MNFKNRLWVATTQCSQKSSSLTHRRAYSGVQKSASADDMVGRKTCDDTRPSLHHRKKTRGLKQVTLPSQCIFSSWLEEADYNLDSNGMMFKRLCVFFSRQNNGYSTKMIYLDMKIESILRKMLPTVKGCSFTEVS